MEFRVVSLPREGSERHSESLLLFMFHGTEFRVIFSSAEGFGTEFREFSVPQNSRNSVGINHLFRLFRLPTICRKLPTLGEKTLQAEIHSPNSHCHLLFEKDVDLFFYIFYFYITKHFCDRSLDCINLT
jgi:hypothetical protein